MVIYKTTNLINGKFYIGQDSKNNPNYLGSGLLLIQAIEKYGKENFLKEILEGCSTKQELNTKEKKWIKALKSQVRGVGYNIADGGLGGDVFSNHPDKEKYRQNISKASKKTNSNPDVIKKLREASKNNWMNPEYRAKVIDRMRFAQQKDQYKQNLSKAMKKVKHTEEWNQKVGHNNSVRYHFKKIEYFISIGVSHTDIANYFNVPLGKIHSDKKFDKEPNVEILIECKILHDKGFSVSSIVKQIANSPTHSQICTFIDMCDTFGACEIINV